MNVTSNMIDSTMYIFSNFDNETEIDTLSRYKLPSSVHITCVAIILTLGISGNAYVFRIYTRKPLSPGNMFLISFAILDLCVILTVLPQIPFISLNPQQIGDTEFIPPFSLMASIYTLMISYLGIMINMSIDRIWAVFRPFTYTKNWKRPLIISSLCVLLGIVLFICTTLVDILLESEDTIRKMVLNLFVIFTFAFIISSYTAILLKLRKQRRVNVASNVTTNETRTR